MRILLFVIVLLSFSISSSAQQPTDFTGKPMKHRFYLYWGWNRGWFSRTDIHFHGQDYDFTLAKVVAHDKQNPIAYTPYLNPSEVTIPQTNMRIGYFLSEHWNLSLGLDHMKYVMDGNQFVDITGYIHNSNTPYDGEYNNNQIQLKDDFLRFEHTNGLNYINVAVRRHDKILDLRRIHVANITINLTEGLEAGALVPKTNTTLLAFQRYDEFHLAGFGMSAIVGMNVTFFDHFFIQSEWKSGFCDMPDIRTTEFQTDRANEFFFFNQANILLGANFRIGNSKTK